MSFRAKAEIAFEAKVRAAFDRGDFERVTEVGEQFDAYQKLVAYDSDFPDPKQKAVEMVAHANEVQEN